MLYKIKSLHSVNKASVLEVTSCMNHNSDGRNVESAAALFTFLHVKWIYHSSHLHSLRKEIH